ncbi:MAG TPA: aldose epimerase family protein [Rhodothermales bacterium]|nr:aldose epimerase family protein [Rhodothermales bacterium]
MSLSLARSNDFKIEIGGTAVDLYTLQAPGGLTAQVTNYGARIVNLFVPDRLGRIGNVVLGFDSIAGYLDAKERFYGATIGRFANRIGGSRFTLDGVSYELVRNEGENHLHGGLEGFDRAVWTARRINEGTIALTYASRHLEQGYPGALSVEVVIRLTSDMSLEITYEATTIAPTIVNLTNHAYFNLAGPGAGDVGDHALQILADEFTPIGDGLIPTGEIAKVDGTPLDFRTPHRIGERVDDDFPQLRLAGGYDHNWVLRPAGGPLRVAVRVFEPTSGRSMEVLTTEPGLQFYGGNFFDGADVGASGRPHRFREAFALETQHFPDSPNKVRFPSTALRPGEVYRSQTVYRFFPIGSPTPRK